MRPNMKEEEVQEVGLADTELIIQVIKCTFHNVHYMWQGLVTDVLGCNSKHGPAEYSGLMNVDELKNSRTQELASLRTLIREETARVQPLTENIKI